MFWCNAHQRQAADNERCDPNLGGPMIPCYVVDLTGELHMTDDRAMEEGRLEEIEMDSLPVCMFAADETKPGKITNCYIDGHHLSEPMFYVRRNGDYVPNLDGYAIVPRAEYESLRAENDALKQQLQVMKGPYPDLAPGPWDQRCRELIQEIADSKICWSDWAGDYIQWTEDITRKARKALGLKDE